MPSSRRWNRNVYFRFNPLSISREFNIQYNELADFDAFLVSPEPLEFCSRGLESGSMNIYPMFLSDLNDVITKIHGPLLKNFWRSAPSLTIKGKQSGLRFPEVMAIMNLTPDSFYAESRTKEGEVDGRLDEIEQAGAKLVDIGGQSTRPGSERISPQEEMKRILKAVEISLNRNFIVSVDSYAPEVLRECLDMGAHLINDVTGMDNPEVGKLAKKYEVPIVLMHKKGDFKTMQHSPSYQNVINEIIDFFYQKISQSAELGIESNIILDPGIGFGKRVEDNLSIIRNLRDLKLGHPLLIGLSRKSFIGEIMGESVDQRGESSLILNTIALMNGADIIRVHDVRDNSKLIKIVKKIKEI
jgi:dihydropteroate synthase